MDRRIRQHLETGQRMVMRSQDIHSTAKHWKLDKVKDRIAPETFRGSVASRILSLCPSGSQNCDDKSVALSL